jgi:5-methylcytosine-specific restriction endonuclease McrA
MIQTWQCQTCGAECQRQAVRGQRPKYCERRECRPKILSDQRCECCGNQLRSDYRRYCSTMCRQRDRAAVKSAAQAARRRDTARAKAALAADGTVAGSTWTWSAGLCDICRRPFVVRTKSPTSPRIARCSARCSSLRRANMRRAAKLRRRAAKRDAYIANVSPRKIYERDRWRCHLCRRVVRRSAVVPHPLAPTIDHVIPLAQGGTHEPANCATAHYRCNNTKGARGSGEQLALIG